MTHAPKDTAAALADDLDAIADPVERYAAMRETEGAFDTAMKRVRQRIALDLKVTRTWREVGEIMGGVSPQRAEQISRGV